MREHGVDPKLEPCPFCGITPVDRGDRASISCGNEQCSVRPRVSAFTKALAIAAWNRRTPDIARGEGAGELPPSHDAVGFLDENGVLRPAAPNRDGGGDGK